MPKISVIIITKNAAHQIAACLESVQWADEIIILDAGSQDNTLAICREFTDSVYVNPYWQGFGVQKNRALAKAQHEWVLSLDADEVVTPALRQEIVQVINIAQEQTAFQIPRQSYYCGRWIKHSWGDDYVTRLFRRKKAKFTEDLVHEKIQLRQGKLGTLTQPILHYSFNSLEEVLEKTNFYSTASAQMLYQNGKRSNLTKAIFHGLWTFLRFYIFKLGFLDGREGFILAVSNAEGTYYRYLKLMYLQEYIQNDAQSHRNHLQSS